MNAWTPPSADAIPTDAPACDGGDPARTERQLWLLDRLADAGLNIVQAVERQAMAESAQRDGGQPAPGQPAPEPPAPAFAGDLALAYSRAARAVRMSIALQARLMAERRDAAVEAAREARMDAVRNRPPRRARIERIVERLAQAEHEHDEEAVERCMAEAAERLDDVDVFGDVLSRPVSETIALICRDLGLSPDWPALAPEAWAREEMAGGDVGAPLRALSHPFPSPSSCSGLTRAPISTTGAGWRGSG